MKQKIVFRLVERTGRFECMIVYVHAAAFATKLYVGVLVVLRWLRHQSAR